MNKLKITIKYKKMVKDVENWMRNIDLYYRVNNYICEDCGHVTKTKDVDHGVTPFIHTCEYCGGNANSTFYNDFDPELPVTQEWYRPPLEECYKLPEGDLDHVLRGGLIPRKIK